MKKKFFKLLFLLFLIYYDYFISLLEIINNINVLIMKILLDNIIYSKTSNGGISNYWFELSNYLLKMNIDDIFFYEEVNALLNFHRNQLVLPNDKILTSNKTINFSLLDRFLSVKLQNQEFDDFFLYHSSFYRSIKGVKNFNEITTVHDFTHDYFFPSHKRILHNYLKYSSIKRSKGIICISENTYKDLKKFCPPNKKQKVQIIYNGVSNDYFKINEDNTVIQNYLEKSNIITPYLLYLGSRVNYKNFSFVAKLFNELPDMNLVIVGNNLSKAELNLFNKESSKRIIVKNNVDNFELNRLYNFAHALIYPSSYEGFGIPIIEAMKAGCPVLSLQNSSIVEVSGNAAILFEELDLLKFKVAIKELNKESFRDEFVEKGMLNAKKYDWDKCCKETHDFYKEMYYTR